MLLSYCSMLGQAENACLGQPFKRFTTMGLALCSCLGCWKSLSLFSMAKLSCLVTKDGFIT
jgi:hypothetical protein